MLATEKLLFYGPEGSQAALSELLSVGVLTAGLLQSRERLAIVPLAVQASPHKGTREVFLQQVAYAGVRPWDCATRLWQWG